MTHYFKKLTNLPIATETLTIDTCVVVVVNARSLHLD